eukprot:507482-Rhodomonas_salina.1
MDSGDADIHGGTQAKQLQQTMAHYSAREARGSEDEPAQRKEEEAKEVKEAIKALERMEEEDEEEEEEEGGAGVQRTLLRELLALLRRRAHIMPVSLSLPSFFLFPSAFCF